MSFSQGNFAAVILQIALWNSYFLVESNWGQTDDSIFIRSFFLLLMPWIFSSAQHLLEMAAEILCARTVGFCCVNTLYLAPYLLPLFRFCVACWLPNLRVVSACWLLVAWPSSSSMPFSTVWTGMRLPVASSSHHSWWNRASFLPPVSTHPQHIKIVHHQSQRHLQPYCAEVITTLTCARPLSLIWFKSGPHFENAKLLTTFGWIRFDVLSRDAETRFYGFFWFLRTYNTKFFEIRIDHQNQKQICEFLKFIILSLRGRRLIYMILFAYSFTH